MTWMQRRQDRIAHDYDAGYFYARSMCGAVQWPVQYLERRTVARRCKRCDRIDSIGRPPREHPAE